MKQSANSTADTIKARPHSHHFFRMLGGFSFAFAKEKPPKSDLPYLSV
jgi:hypothetical protein